MNFTDSQREALKEGGNFLVSASAGSGKTAVMIQRIIDTLEKGGKISRILALTFTNAAAEEMKDKLVNKLYESIRNDNSKKKEHLRAQIADIPFSYICTIDSFCLGLYRTYFEDISGTPLFQVLDKDERTDIFKGICRDVVTQCLEKNDEAVLELIDSFMETRSHEPLIDAVFRLDEFLNVQEDYEEFLQRARGVVKLEFEQMPAVKYIVKLFKNQLRELSLSQKALLSRVKATNAYELLKPEYEEGMSYCQKLIGLLINADNLNQICDILSGKIEIFAPRDRKAFSEAVYDEIRVEAKGFLKAVKEFVEDWRISFMVSEGQNNYSELERYEKEANKNMLSLIDLTVRVREEYSKYKEKEGRPDFADLERFAYKILQNEDRAKQVRDSLDYIFLDEYQDINYLQEAIIKKCAKDNVFMVGDVKQSIYGFRYAEPSIFINKKKSFEDLAYSAKGRGKSVKLNENFRSHIGILEFVNIIFEQLMTTDFGDIDYLNESRLVNGLKDENSFQRDKSLENPVHICFFPKDSLSSEQKKAQIAGLEIPYSPVTGQKLKEKCSDEAIYIAQSIEDLVGKKLIYDAKLQTKRYCEYKDIAIIMRTRKGGEIGNELKKRQIPFIAEGFEAEDRPVEAVKSIINYLSVIDNYQNDYALYGAMRSYFGGFSEEEAVRIRSLNREGFFWSAVKNYPYDDQVSAKIEAFFKRIEEFRRLSAFVSAEALINAVMTKTGYDNYLLAHSEVEEIEALNAFTYSLKGRETTKDLTAFLRYYQDKDINIRMIPGKDNYVSFFTVHSSKGLEFPVVFLAGCEIGLNKVALTRTNILMDSRLGVGLRYRQPLLKISKPTLSFRAFQKNAERKEKEELLRLLYVAMTRARYYLYITGQKCNDKFLASSCDNFSEYIALALRKRCLDMPYDEFIRREPIVGIDKKPQLPKEKEQAKEAFNYPYKNSLELLNKYTVSELAGKGKMHEYWATDTQSQDIGNTYHLFLQELDFSVSTKEEVENAISDFENVHSGQEGIIKAENILWFLNSEVFSGLSRYKTLKEKPFLLYLPARELFDTESEDKVLLQGVFDLVILGEKNRLVDYKLTGMDEDSVRKRYKEQLRLYGIAAKKLLNVELDESIICLINQKKLLKL